MSKKRIINITLYLFDLNLAIKSSMQHMRANNLGTIFLWISINVVQNEIPKMRAFFTVFICISEKPHIWQHPLVKSIRKHFALFFKLFINNVSILNWVTNV
jgi:hypothetical protein